jgi:hypothetical protein
MATCTVKRKTPPPAPPPEIESVTLVLSKNEALALQAVLYNVGGAAPMRNYVEGISNLLVEVGVEYVKGKLTGALYFKEGATL